MLDIEKLREQSKNALLERIEQKQLQNLEKVEEVFTPCLLDEWEETIQTAALKGENFVFIPLKYDKFCRTCYEMLFDLAELHFKPQGFECDLKCHRHMGLGSGLGSGSRSHNLRIKW